MNINIFCQVTGDVDPFWLTDTSQIIKQVLLTGNCSVIHPEAMFANGVTIGSQCSIGKCTIGENVHLGERITIGNKVVIGNNVTLKGNVELMLESFVGENTVIGQSTIIAPQAIIGSDCSIGAFNQIDNKVVIGFSVKTGNRKVFAEGSTIGAQSKIM